MCRIQDLWIMVRLMTPLEVTTLEVTPPPPLLSAVIDNR